MIVPVSVRLFPLREVEDHFFMEAGNTAILWNYEME